MPIYHPTAWKYAGGRSPLVLLDQFLKAHWAPGAPEILFHSPMTAAGWAWHNQNPQAAHLHVWAVLSIYPSVIQMLFSMCAMIGPRMEITVPDDHLSGTPRREFLTWVGAYIRQQMWGAFPLRPTFLTASPLSGLWCSDSDLMTPLNPPLHLYLFISPVLFTLLRNLSWSFVFPLRYTIFISTKHSHWFGSIMRLK